MDESTDMAACGGTRGVPGRCPLDVASLLRDGVTIIEAALTDDQCRQSLEGIDWAMRTQVGLHPLLRQRTYEYFRQFPIFVELIEHPLAIGVADQCLGSEYHLICAEITRNEKDNHYQEDVKNAHQDRCFFPEQPELREDLQNRMYGFTAQWVILDIPAQMGPTQFIPESHIGGTPDAIDRPDSCFAFQDHFPKGSLVLYDHRTWHRGTDNHSDRPRDLIQNSYALHAVDKVQLRTPTDAGDVYIPCESLIDQGSETIRRLLSRSDFSGHGAARRGAGL
jgi:hypothetical protein